jgi:hypothetical protein
MLAGSLLAECESGRVGDRFVTPDFTWPLGILAIIEKRNSQYTTKKSGNDPESHASTTALRLPEDSVRSDNADVPELRLMIAMLGVLMCIVGEVAFSKIPATDGIPLGQSIVVRFWSWGHLHWVHLAVASGLGACGVQMVTSIA